MLASLEDAAAFLLRQRVELREESPVKGRSAVGEQVHEHRTASGDFARLIRARALVAFQAEKLKPVREGHSDFIVMLEPDREETPLRGQSAMYPKYRIAG